MTKYILKDYDDLIDEISYIIANNNISKKYISKRLDISKTMLNKILFKKVKSTKININNIYSIVNLEYKRGNTYYIDFNILNNKKLKLFDINNDNQNYGYNNEEFRYLRIVLAILYIYEKIINYDDFFCNLFYLSTSRKKNIFNNLINKLQKNKIINIVDTSIFKGNNYFFVSVPKKSFSYYSNFLIKYFRNIKSYKNATIASFYYNNLNFEENFYEYIYQLQMNGKYDLIILLYNNYFNMCKINNKRKSKQFRIMYNIIQSINYYLKLNTSKSIFFMDKSLKLLNIKKNILNTNYNNLIISDFSKLLRKYSKETKCTYLYFIKSFLYYTLIFYSKAGLYKIGKNFQKFCLNFLEDNDPLYYQYYGFDYFRIFDHGDLEDLEKLYKNIKHHKYSKYMFGFYYELFHDIDLADKTINQIELYKFDAYNKRKIILRKITLMICQKQYKNAFSELLLFIYSSNSKIQREVYFYIIFHFLSLIKNYNHLKIVDFLKQDFSNQVDQLYDNEISDEFEISYKNLEKLTYIEIISDYLEKIDISYKIIKEEFCIVKQYKLKQIKDKDFYLSYNHYKTNDMKIDIIEYNMYISEYNLLNAVFNKIDPNNHIKNKNYLEFFSTIKENKDIIKKDILKLIRNNLNTSKKLKQSTKSFKSFKSLLIDYYSKDSENEYLPYILSKLLLKY